MIRQKRERAIRLALMGIAWALILLAGGGQSLGADGPGAGEAVLATLTAEEKEWLHAHPVVPVASDPAWPPVEFCEPGGEFRGIVYDYMGLIERRLGIKFDPARHLSWQESYARLKRREIAMATCVAETPQRRAFWTFTKPYLSIPIVIFTRTDVPYIATLDELKGKKVAVVDGYAIQEWMALDHPEIVLAAVGTPEEALDKLERGEIFAYLDNMLVIGHYTAQRRVSNVKIAGQTPYRNDQSMAVRSDWPILAGILQKALDDVSAAERAAIYHRWVPIRYEHGFDHSLLWKALALFLAVLSGLLLWNRRLGSEIRQRRKAEEGLRESEGRLLQITESLKEVFWLFDWTQQRVLYVSPAYETIWGRAREALYARYEEWAESIHPEDRADARESFGRILTIGGGKPREYRILRPDGAVRWISDVGYAVKDSDGRVIRLTGIAEDVTERKRGEEALRQANLVVENSPVVIFRWRAAEGWPVAMVSQNVTQFGYTPQELLSGAVPFAEMVYPDDLERVAREVQEHTAGGAERFQQEYRIVTRDGRLRWVDDRTVVERGADGQVLFYQGIVIDITERRQAEDALRESEERFAVFMDNLPAGAFMKDAPGTLIYANRYLHELFGWDRAVGRTTPELLPADVAAKMEADDRAALAGGPLFFTETVRDAAGRDRVFHTWKFPVARRDRPPLLGGVAVDITELKRAQEALQSSLEEKESLIAEVHHRVKNTLQVISSLLSLQAGGVKNAEVRSLLKDTQNRIGSMAVLHEILYSSGNLAMIRFPQYVRSVCAHLARSHGSETRRIRIRQMIEEISLGMDQAVPAGLIINELVSNAFKHAFPSGDAEGEIAVQAGRSDGGRLVLRVADNGVGMPAGPPWQHPAALGLRLVENLVRQLDGELAMGSGPGADFQITFPSQPAKEATA
jgi:PAS domain S-box-containing protein